MTDPTEPALRPFRVVLDGGEVIESAGADRAAPELVLRLPVSRAHSLAHLLDDWFGALGPVSSFGSGGLVLSRTLEAGAAALGDLGALSCAAREFTGVTAPQRLAAVTVLAERESRLSAVQRVAVVDAAARWLAEQSGDEFAYALLAAVCGTDVTTSQVYTALLVSPMAPERGASS